MVIHNRGINGYRRVFIGIFLIILIIFPLTTLSGSEISSYNNQSALNHFHKKSISSDSVIETLEEKNYIGNYSFDAENLNNYLDSLYDASAHAFLDSVSGYQTTISTYEALAILRILGLDFYQFSGGWQANEAAIVENFIDNLEDDSGSGGYRLYSEENIPSVEGTFGVVNTLRLMNELTLKLKPISPKLFNYIYNHSFDFDNFGFHEHDEVNNLKTTFEALSIIDIIYKVIFEITEVDYDITIALNKSITNFMGNYSVEICNFINESLTNSSFFYDFIEYRSPIEDTWYALKSIAILEFFGDLLNVSLPLKLVDFQTSVRNWLNTLVKTEGLTKGGYGFSEAASVKETALTYAISDLLNTSDDINDSQALLFINSSQFLKRENRTYLTSEKLHLGGFGPNNLTFSNPNANKRINIHDTYYASIAYLFSGSIFESISLSMETSYYQNNPDINRSNYIIQGEISTIEMSFITFNFKSHGSLTLTSTIDNWNITHPIYNEKNIVFTGKDTALYTIDIANDSNLNYNWTLGLHTIINRISIRNLPVFTAPEYLLNSSIFVGYAPSYDFTPMFIQPGSIVNSTIFYQNRSLISNSINNITVGNLTASLTSPSGQSSDLFSYKPINDTIDAFEFKITFLNNSLLGTWYISISFNISDFKLEATLPLEVSDDIELYAIDKASEYYPGKSMNLNVSLAYSNNHFTPEANASIHFISNVTGFDTFNLSLTHVSDNEYTTSNEIIPSRLLFGSYNLSIRLSWNVSSGYQISTITNHTLENIQIKGLPVLFPILFKTDYRNLSLSDSYTVYYGESVSFSFMVGLDTPSGFINVSTSNVDMMGGFVNGSDETKFLQLFDFSHNNESFFLNGLINPNFLNSTYGTRFKIKSDWNNSFVYVKTQGNLSMNYDFDVSLKGKFEIENVRYYTEEIQDELYVYAIDSSSVISISFEIINTDYSNIPVPNLNLYGILDIQGKIGDLNQSLPSIISAFDENNTHFYQLAIPPANLDLNDYQISIFTKTAIANDLMVGVLTPGFRIISTFNPQFPIALQDGFLLIMVVIFMGLLYQNLKKKD
jgi:hypothetical protein